MAVVAPTTTFGVRRQGIGRDAHGSRVSTGLGPLQGPYPGAIVSEPALDGDPATGAGVWVLALDPAFWPVEGGAHVVEPSTGRSWTVTEAEHRPSRWDPGLSYIRAEAMLNAS